MKIKAILFILAFLAFLFAVLSEYTMYSSWRSAAVDAVKQQCETNIEITKRNLTSYLSKNVKPVLALSKMDSLALALQKEHPRSIIEANKVLDIFKNSLDVSVCYLMNQDGQTVASSNRNTPDSFLGQNFSFRPYFKQAMQGKPYVYLALGTTSGKRGVYYSQPVYGPNQQQILGVVVIKALIEYVETKIISPFKGIFMLSSPSGVIFICNKKEWLFETTHKLNPAVKSRIEESKQFGAGPWEWTGLRLDEEMAVDKQGREYITYSREIEGFPGWELMYFYSQKAISNSVQKPLRITALFLIILCLLIGLLVFLLYSKAKQELAKRKKAEEELRKSENNYKLIYHKTPAMLHSINRDYRFISVSDYWLETTGYTREEVIGRKLTDFFTRKSKQYAENIILPRFFKTGWNKDIPYQFLKKNGEIMDISLSCYGIEDKDGQIDRTLAISIDVTEINRTQQDLQRTKEQLRQYSKDLERQVRKRTREISGILENTPAVIYIKNTSGEYRLINSRYEKLFNISNAEIQGQTDFEHMPQELAQQFHDNDMQVLKAKSECQFTEFIEQEDGTHTYLSVKFPIYDDNGQIDGVCGISTDITELQKVQDKLRRLSNSILESQEKERAAISRELHDELGQLMTTLNMDAVWLEKRFKDADTKAAHRAAIMREVIDQTIARIRHMAFQLRPGLLDDLGLVDALESLSADFEKRTDMVFLFHAQNIPSLDNNRATAAYRIVQEAMTNAARHSRASKVEIFLKAENGDLTLEVLDDGQGFDLQRSSLQNGFGITGMQERANLVGGTLEFKADINQGTRILCRIPLN